MKGLMFALVNIIFANIPFQPVEEHINQLVEALRDTARNPDIAAPQLALINASKEFIQVDEL